MLRQCTPNTCLMCGHTCHILNCKCNHVGIALYKLTKRNCQCSSCQCLLCINNHIESTNDCFCTKIKQINKILHYIDQNKTMFP